MFSYARSLSKKNSASSVFASDPFAKNFTSIISNKKLTSPLHSLAALPGSFPQQNLIEYHLRQFSGEREKQNLKWLCILPF